MDGIFDNQHGYRLLIAKIHCHWIGDCHNHIGIRHHFLHDDQVLFPELYYHSNYTWNIIFIFWANDLNCTWRHFSFKPFNFERAIFGDPTTVFRLKIWKVCCCSLVPYPADVICLRLIFSLMAWEHDGNELLFIFFRQKITAPLVFGLYFFMNISKRYHSPNLAVSSHIIHRQVSQFYFWNFIEITLLHGYSPVNLLHIFRTAFRRNTSGWLLPQWQSRYLVNSERRKQSTRSK